MRSTAQVRRTKKTKDIIVYIRMPRSLHAKISKEAHEKDKSQAAVIKSYLDRAYA